MEIFTIMGAAFALFGLPLAWFGVHRYRKQGARFARASTAWTKTRATVIDAQLIERESTDREGDSTTWHEPKLRYSYAVDGRPLEGSKTALCEGPKFWREDLARQWLAAHAPGTEIDLWYDPEHPEDSAPALDKPSLFSAAIMVLVGAGFVLFGGAMLAGML